MKKKLHFVITAGPTREHLDPVRFLSNPSTGKMGFALARAAVAGGHRATLISGPVLLKTPHGVSRENVTSAREMLASAEKIIFANRENQNRENCDFVFVATAAVADWRPAKFSRQKLKKDQMSDTIKLVRNPDVLKTISRKSKSQIVLVGFAAETTNVLSEAARKCRAKGLDLVVANDVTAPGAGFGHDTNRVSFVFRDGTHSTLPLMSKLSVAKKMVKQIEILAREKFAKNEIRVQPKKVKK